MTFKNNSFFQYSFFVKIKRNAFIFILVLFSISSCRAPKSVAYFQDLTDTSKIYTQAINSTYNIKIQPDDIVEIIVNNINSDAAAPFNLGNSMPSSTIQPMGGSNIPNITGNATKVTGSNGTGYLVEKDGSIDFPVLGKINVQGLTIPQLKDTLKSSLNKYLQAPIINIRLLNYKITVLGEVAHPATYSIPSERITVVDAIGMAGDLTIYGKRENVLLVREEDGERKFVRLNLDSSKIFTSQYYYLKQNDIVYVEPNKEKVLASSSSKIKTISIITAALTLLVVLATRIK